MREIKFRGKRIDNGEWVYGFFVKSLADDNGNQKFLIIEDTTMHQANIRKFQHEVIPESVGQFTGILDKNKKEIYGGDVVSGGHMAYMAGQCDCNYLIEYVDCYVAFRAIVTKYSKGKKRLEFAHQLEDIDGIEGMEIIGNQTDNPELLITKEK